MILDVNLNGKLDFNDAGRLFTIFDAGEGGGSLEVGCFRGDVGVGQIITIHVVGVVTTGGEDFTHEVVSPFHFLLLEQGACRIAYIETVGCLDE